MKTWTPERIKAARAHAGLCYSIASEPGLPEVDVAHVRRLCSALVDALDALQDRPSGRDLFLAALRQWGPDAQTWMAVEELGELLTSIARLRRWRDDVTKLVDELADVGIMLDQLALIYDCEDKVRERRAFKLNRLRERLGIEPEDVEG